MVGTDRGQGSGVRGQGGRQCWNTADGNHITVLLQVPFFPGGVKSVTFETMGTASPALAMCQDLPNRSDTGFRLGSHEASIHFQGSSVLTTLCGRKYRYLVGWS